MVVLPEGRAFEAEGIMILRQNCARPVCQTARRRVVRAEGWKLSPEPWRRSPGPDYIGSVHQRQDDIKGMSRPHLDLTKRITVAAVWTIQS